MTGKMTALGVGGGFKKSLGAYANTQHALDQMHRHNKKKKSKSSNSLMQHRKTMNYLFTLAYTECEDSWLFS